MIGERIKRARLAAGLSLREAAERAELSAMAISKFERGEITPTSATLLRLAGALETRTEFFLRPDTAALEAPKYRKHASLGAKELARIEADILNQVERFLELLALFPQPPLEPFQVPASLPAKVTSLDGIEELAAALQDAWRLGSNAIPCLADTLEERGLLVLTTNAGTSARFDGLAATVGGFPLVVVGANWPGDRQRFTMGHELGHLVLAGRLAEDLDEEKACNRFAGAFLAPRDAVRMELGKRRSNLQPRELHSLKLKYGLSMLAWVLRAREAGVIERVEANALFSDFTNKGWREQEPGAGVTPEHPKLFERLVLRALAEDMISNSQAAELMGMPLGTFRRSLTLEGARGAAHQ